MDRVRNGTNFRKKQRYLPNQLLQRFRNSFFGTSAATRAAPDDCSGSNE